MGGVDPSSPWPAPAPRQEPPPSASKRRAGTALVVLAVPVLAISGALVATVILAVFALPFAAASFAALRVGLRRRRGLTPSDRMVNLGILGCVLIVPVLAVMWPRGVDADDAVAAWVGRGILVVLAVWTAGVAVLLVRSRTS